MKLEVKAASKGHQEEGDHLVEQESDAPATREKGRRNPVAPPVEPVDLSVMARKEAPKAPATPAAAPAPPSKESVRERLAAALRGELKLPTTRKADEAPAPPPTPPPAPQISQKPSETVPSESKKSEVPSAPKPLKQKQVKAPKPAPAPVAPTPQPVAATPAKPMAPPQQATTPAQPAPSKPKPAPASAPATMDSPAAPAKEAPKDGEGDAKPSDAPKPPKRPMQVRFTGMKPMHVVEAALFAAGKPVSVEEVAESTGLPPDSVKQAVKDLQKDYEGRDTMLEVSKAGTKWGMQVKSQAAEPPAKFAPMEIAPKLLKTLALIAYHQPLKQSELVDMLGTKVYDHVPELIERGLVRAREEGVTKILTTTPAFPEYFGLDATGPDEVRQVMGKLVGIEAPPKKREPEPAAEAAPAPEAPAGPAAGSPSGEAAGPTQA